MKKIPALRIAVTNKCNMNCQYCPIDGDSYLIEKPPLDPSSFIRIVTIANQAGITNFSITGGEPLVVPDLTFSLAKGISRFQKLDYLKLNTNGLFLEKFIPDITSSGFTEIKVSLDTLIPNSVYTLSHYESKVNPIINGIKQLIQYVPVRLQTVATKKNFDQIENIISFCDQFGLNLKVFDLTYYPDSLASNPKFWKQNYVSLHLLAKKLSKKYGQPKIVHAVGGYGHSNLVFVTPAGTTIMLRDTETTAHYVTECQKCQSYMCQDGVCTLTLSTDGRLKICRPKGLDFGLDLTDSNNKLKTDKEILTIFKKALKIFHSAKEVKRSFSELNLPNSA